MREKETKKDQLTGARGGGGLQGLLEHAAREYEKVDTETTAPDAVRSQETSAALGKWSNQPAGSPQSSESADIEEQSTDGIASNRSRGSGPRDAGTPSRKRQRVDLGLLGVSPSSPCRGLNNFSEDGGPAGQSYGGDAEAFAEGPGQQSSSAELCQYEGCSKAARSGGLKFCRRHGEGRRCRAPGCNKVDVGGGSCRKHGGGRRCGADGCMKTDVGGGYCVSHGGGKRCQSEGCAKGAQAGGVFCKSHGGGRRCRIEGCMTSAQSGANVLCIKHGGGKRCMVVGCKKLVRKNNRCTKHASEVSNTNTLSPSLPVPVPVPVSVPVPASAAMNVAKTKAAVAATAAVLTATTAFARVAPAPYPRRRPAPPSRSTEMEPGPPSPPEQIEAQARGDGGLLPSMSLMAMEPSPNFGPGAGVPLRGLSSLRPPMAAFGGRVSAAEGPMHGVTSWVPDGTGSNANVFSLRSSEPRLWAPLPGIGSIGSMNQSLLRVDPRSGTREALMSVGQLAPHSSSAAPLHSREAGLARDLLHGGNTAARESGGRAAVASNLLTHPRQEMVGPSPPCTRGVPVGRPPLPYRASSSRFSEGAIERSPSLSPLPPSLRLQQPLPFAPSYLPAAAAAANSCDTGGGGRRGLEWSGDAGPGSRPAASFDDRGGIPPNGSNPSSWTAGQPASAPELAPPSAGATTGSPVGAIVVGDSGEPKASGGSVSSSTPGGGAPGALSEPVAASQSMEVVHLAPAAERPSRPPCCGSKNLAPGGTKAWQDSATFSTEAAAAAASVGDTWPSKARSCCTSPPLEQTSSFISMSIKGMMCMENCGQTVQRALREIPGVQSVTIHFPTRTASVKVDTAASVSPTDLTSALDAIGFGSSCIASTTSTTTEEPTLEQDGVNAVWAIASALGLVDRGCAMAWGDPCSCGDECQCVNCPQHGKHIKEVSHAVDLVLKAADLSSSKDPAPPPNQPQQLATVQSFLS